MGMPVQSILDSPISPMVGRTTDAFMGAISITPADTSALPDPPSQVRGLLVNVSGNVVVTMNDGTIVTLPLTAGVVYAVVVSKVWATGTTATGIVGLY